MSPHLSWFVVVFLFSFPSFEQSGVTNSLGPFHPVILGQQANWMQRYDLTKLLLVKLPAANILPRESSKGGHWTLQIATFLPSDETLFLNDTVEVYNFLHIDEHFQLNASAYF